MEAVLSGGDTKYCSVLLCIALHCTAQIIDLSTMAPLLTSLTLVDLVETTKSSDN
jgi:hypothetical protein